MGRASRLFDIIQILRRAPGPVCAQAMADALEVSRRTVYRDIVALQAMRVPVEGEAGVGYIVRAGFDLPPLTFTGDEVEAIVVGLSLIGRTGDADLLAAASRVARKVEAVLPNVAGSRLAETPLHVSHWNTVPPAAVDYRMMREAIRQERKLHFSYLDAEGRSTERTVRPIALIYYVDNTILAAWCELRGDFRHFRVDRISACAVTDGRFTGEGGRMHAEWRIRHELFTAAGSG